MSAPQGVSGDKTFAHVCTIISAPQGVSGDNTFGSKVEKIHRYGTPECKVLLWHCHS